jgi:hypothetical protein
MSSVAYYRAEAARCRELAAKSQDADAIKRWLQMSSEYELLAESMGVLPQIGEPSPQVQRMPMQQQEIQQQQAKAGEADNEADNSIKSIKE